MGLQFVQFRLNHLMSASCGGSALPGLDVTLPEKLGVISGINVLYSIVPWAAALVLIVAAVYHRRTTLVAGVILLAIMIVLNEAVLKNILKQPRPSKSCVSSPGMPSSHSVLSLGFVVFIALEMFFHQWQFSRLTKLQIFIGSVFLLVPVPASRVGLHDHSPVQVGVGILVGAIVAAAFFAVMHFVVGQKLEQLVELPLAVKLGLVNDYVLDANDVDLITKVRNRTASKYRISSSFRRGSSVLVPAPGSSAGSPPPLSTFKAFIDDEEKPPQLDGLENVEDKDLLVDPDAIAADVNKVLPPRVSEDGNEFAAREIPFPTATDTDDVLFARSDDDDE